MKRFSAKVRSPGHNSEEYRTVSAPDPGPPNPIAWLDVIPVMWLIVVAACYAILADYPMSARGGEVPGIPAAEQAVVPMLAAIGVAALIRRRQTPETLPAARPTVARGEVGVRGRK
jgi:hypothetical protein